MASYRRQRELAACGLRRHQQEPRLEPLPGGRRRQPVFCASEERFTRVKLQRGMPHRTFEHAVRRSTRWTTRRSRSRGSEPVRRIAARARSTSASARKGLFSPPIVARSDRGRRHLWARKKILRDRELHRVSVDTRYFAGRTVDLAPRAPLLPYGLGVLLLRRRGSGDRVGGRVGDLLSAVIGRGRGERFEVIDALLPERADLGSGLRGRDRDARIHPDKHPGKVTGLAGIRRGPGRAGR